MRTFSIIRKLLAVNLLFITSTAFAVCPICTIAVGAGIGLAKYLNIDDSITGIWIGGFIASLVGWTIYWLDKKNIRFYGRKISIIIIYYSAIIIPLYAYGIAGNILNKLWGMDKILLGIIVGSITFLMGVIIYNLLKEKNNNRPYFALQKILIPIILLTIISVIFSCLAK